MTIHVRSATTSDRETFLDLWIRHLLEIESFGSEIAASDRTREGFGELFDIALRGDGLALVAEVKGQIVGAHLARIADLPWDLSLGSTALAFGTYVVPEFRRCGAASTLREAALAELTRMGVRTVLFSQYPGNTAGEESLRRWPNARQLHTTYAYSLEDR